MGMRLEEDEINELYKASLSGSTTTLALSPWSETPLHISASNGHLELSKTLLDRNPRQAVEVDYHKRCPLHLACAEGDIEIAKVLLRANKNACFIPDEDGRLPLHYAVKSGLVELVRELISAQPDSITQVASCARLGRF
ncbi:ankyrin repeat-containing protein BDA1-like isoform X2 [Fagus crenata]